MNAFHRPAIAVLSAAFLVVSCQTASHGPTGPKLPSAAGGPLGGGIPTAYSISAPYPNPFNPTTAVDITIPRESDVLLVAQNPVGDIVETLVSETWPAGYHHVIWDASKGGTRDLKAGLYFITLHAGDFVGSRVVKLEK